MTLNVNALDASAADLTAQSDLLDGKHAWYSTDALHRRSLLERMPKWLICVPLVLQWLWLAARYRSLSLPSCANPTITAGGLVGEGKLEYFAAMGPFALAATAPHCSLSTHRKYTGAELRQVLEDAGLEFPLIAKPDLGLCGYGVRRVASRHELLEYLGEFPANECVVLQQWLPQEGEAGIFYARDPGAETGHIIGLTLRYFPRVVGDGWRTVSELVALDARAQRASSSARHRSKLHISADHIPKLGEIVRLATIGSTRVGGLYRDGAALITPQLSAAVDDIARDMDQFHFGRFDVRFDSLADLRAGRGLVIMEVNGAGSEAIHAWDPDTPVLKGFAMIFDKQRRLFEMGHAMRRQGCQPIAVRQLMQLNSRQNRLMALYPPSN
jgi:hypothetical protein